MDSQQPYRINKRVDLPANAWHKNNKQDYSQSADSSPKGKQGITFPKNSDNQISPSKINYLRPVESKNRRLSCSNNAFFSRAANDDQQTEKQFTKSHQSVIEQDKISYGVPELGWEYHPPEEDTQSYFNKKMRTLQAKFKKSTLQIETVTLKLKEQRNNLTNQLNFYKKFLAENHPQIAQQINQKFTGKEQFGSNSSDNSSSKSDGMDEEIIMPVKSQIIEVKLEGQKLCQKIKVYEHQVRELTMKMAKKSADGGWPTQKKDREKKQSFQTTLISEKSEKTISDGFSSESMQSSELPNKLKFSQGTEGALLHII